MKRVALVITVWIAVSQAAAAFSAFTPRELFDFEVVIPEEEKVETDLLVAAGNVIIEGDVTGEVVVTGGNVLISGEIGKGLKIYGGNIELSGTANEGAQVFGANVEITGHVKGRLSAAGMKLILDGTFDDEVDASGGRIEVNGTFAEGLNLYAYRAELGPETVIEGDLEYTVEENLTKDPAASVKGEIKDITEQTREEQADKLRQIRLVFSGVLFLSFVVTGLILHAVFPKYLGRVSNNMLKSFSQSILVGFLAVIGVPLAAVVMAITVIGIPTALILTSAYFIAMYLSFVVAGTFVGRLMIGAFTSKQQSPMMLSMFIGLLAICLVSFIPRVGPFLTALLTISGFGGFVIGLYKKKTPTALVICQEEKETTDESDREPPQ
jgi:cytoskeletal protein CcmA (bactofilin family)